MSMFAHQANQPPITPYIASMLTTGKMTPQLQLLGFAIAAIIQTVAAPPQTTFKANSNSSHHPLYNDKCGSTSSVSYVNAFRCFGNRRLDLWAIFVRCVTPSHD